MKLDNKHFPLFMVVIAIIAALSIIYSSINYKGTQAERFKEGIAESDSLLTKELQYVFEDDSLSVQQFKGNNVVLLFWATWSEKSQFMIDEIYTLADQTDSLVVLAAIVKDARETIDESSLRDGLYYVDGADLFNDLKVPGIPSYILFDPTGKVKYVHIGYQENAGYGLLRDKINE
ncbi:TlpA family protein disulfide reductase [Balneola vulgaris]|uniref:TlpA family protein disulfide reductase n=1 Tax=Balneola vulgaris TaxID=287535 RepID=UPI0003730731|nr:hypothetical protein [Balneola vulgaris]